MTDRFDSELEIRHALARVARGVSVRTVSAELCVSEPRIRNWLAMFDGLDEPELAAALRLRRENAALSELIAGCVLENRSLRALLEGLTTGH